MRHLLALLPGLPVRPDGLPDLRSTDPAQLRALSEHAEDCMRVAQSGLTANQQGPARVNRACPWLFIRLPVLSGDGVVTTASPVRGWVNNLLRHHN